MRFRDNRSEESNGFAPSLPVSFSGPIPSNYSPNGLLNFIHVTYVSLLLRFVSKLFSSEFLLSNKSRIRAKSQEVTKENFNRWICSGNVFKVLLRFTAKKRQTKSWIYNATISSLSGSNKKKICFVISIKSSLNSQPNPVSTTVVDIYDDMLICYLIQTTTICRGSIPKLKY